MDRKQITCKLDGKEYAVKFSMRVPLLWERSSGKNYFETFGSGNKPSLTDILTLVWAAFKNGGCTLSLEELSDKLSDKDLQEFSAKIMLLAADNSSKPEEGADEAPLPVQPQA